MDRLRATIASAVAECGSYLSRFRMIRPDTGDIIWVDDRGHGVRGPDGSVRLNGVILDVSARHKAETALRASEEFNRTVLENSPDCIKVPDGAGQVEYMNQNGLCLLEIDDFGAWRGQPWSRFWPEAERPKVCAAVEQALRGEVARFIAPAPTAKGNPRWWDVIVAPIAPASGEGGKGGVRSLISVSRDITEQKAVEAELHLRTTELRESEARMRLATEATTVGIWEWNVRTHTIRWDAQMFRIYGLAPTPDGFVRYSDCSGAVLPEDLAETERILQDTVRRWGQSRREFRIRRHVDGEVRDIEGVDTARTDDQGQIEWVIGTNLDVTRRNQMEQELHLDNEQLEKRVVERSAQLRALAVELTQTEERERRRIAQILHDGLQQLLVGATVHLEIVQIPGPAWRRCDASNSCSLKRTTWRGT